MQNNPLLSMVFLRPFIANLLDGSAPLPVKILEFAVDLKPQAEKRHAWGQGHAYTHADTRARRRELSIIARAGINPRIPLPVTGPVAVFTRYEFERPKSNKSPFELHTYKPDTDNLDKMTWDSLSKAGIWKDDAQVSGNIPEKVWVPHGQQSRIIVAVFALDGAVADTPGMTKGRSCLAIQTRINS